MPHLFTDRPRLYALTREAGDARAQFRWETVNAVLYKLGGLVFIAGSVLFFPALSAYADLGAWTFFAGSLLYLVVTVQDLIEALRHRRRARHRDLPEALELVAAASYLTGTLLFTVGSLFFLSRVGWEIAGAWCFIAGSLLFVLGACINVLRITRAHSILTLQLMNLTAVSFVVGSVLFTVASIPYLWTGELAATRQTLYAFIAAQYLAGSLLFLAGGVCNYWRAYAVIRRRLHAARVGADPARAESDGPLIARMRSGGEG
ncbi:MAG: hypothetical protein GVY28_04505 [Alphaproteobacteria bacterium]|jgi:hypothetical protein|nr:hypothetical protein [Alphaproteobacteria bacterium]